MDGEASFEHVVHVQIVERFLFMDLPQNAVDDAVVLYPENFHLGAGNSCLQALTQVANDLNTVVNDFEPGPSIGVVRCRQFKDAA